MIELKQVYAGRARYVYPVGGPIGLQLWEILDFQERTLPEELVTATLKAWAKKPFVSTAPLQLQVEDVGQQATTYDVFIWVYVQDHCAYPTLEDAKLQSSAGWRGL